MREAFPKKGTENKSMKPFPLNEFDFSNECESHVEGLKVIFNQPPPNVILISNPAMFSHIFDDDYDEAIPVHGI